MSKSCNSSIRVSFDPLGPTFSDVVKCSPPEWLPLIVIGGVLFGVICSLYYWMRRDFDRFRWRYTFQLNLTYYVLGVYVAYAALNLLSMLNLRGAALYEYLSDIVEAVGVLCFYHLIWIYAGSYEELKSELGKVRITVGEAPFCCLKLCTPLVPASQTLFRVIWCLVLQLPVLQVVLGLLNISAWFNEDSGSANVGDVNSKAMTILGVLLAVSFPAAVYGICLQDSALAKFYKGRRHVKFKFALYKSVIMLSKIQSLLFSFFSSDVQSYGYVSPSYRVKIWNSFLIIVESTVFLFVASIAYHRTDFEETDRMVVLMPECDTTGGILEEDELVATNTTRPVVDERGV